jgi:hypothetical protein
MVVASCAIPNGVLSAEPRLRFRIDRIILHVREFLARRQKMLGIPSIVGLMPSQKRWENRRGDQGRACPAQIRLGSAINGTIPGRAGLFLEGVKISVLI